LIYLDNAATTWPKPYDVRRAVAEAMVLYGANPGRSGHRMAMAAAREVYRCREAAAAFFSLPDPAGVVFTANCTAALNIAIKGILRDGGRAVISDMEHNSVLRPLHALSPGAPRYDIARVVPGDDPATVRNFERMITPETRAIVCTHASNAFGTVLPIADLADLARRSGLLMVVDGAQTAGMLPIDMGRTGIDFLCVPGHKGLYGPAGTGMLLCGSAGKLLPPLTEGGTGVNSLAPDQPEELPERLEAGTLNTAGICGLRAGLRWVSEQGEQAGRRKMRQLAEFYRMMRGVPGVSIYTGEPAYGASAAVLSLNIAGQAAETVAAELDRHGIAVRAGLHCAPLAHRHYGTIQTGTVRFSPSIFTVPEDYQKVYEIIRGIAAKTVAKSG